MAITDFTTFSDIRASLGVSDDEIEDATLSLELYESNLAAEFDDVTSDAGSSLSTAYATVSAITSRNEAEERLYRSTRLFSTYTVAKQLCSSLPLFSPKEMTDGKAAMTRYSADPYKETITQVKAQYDKSRRRLVDALKAYVSTTASTGFVPRTSFAVSQPSYDPVTG